MLDWSHKVGEEREEVNPMCASCESRPATHGEVCCQCYEPDQK
jgi:hypothetical protein